MNIKNYCLSIYSIAFTLTKYYKGEIKIGLCESIIWGVINDVALILFRPHQGFMSIIEILTNLQCWILLRCVFLTVIAIQKLNILCNTSYKLSTSIFDS